MHDITCLKTLDRLLNLISVWGR